MLNNSSLFTSMNSVLLQRNSARLSRYQSLYEIQQAKKDEEAESYIQKLINQSTKNLYPDKLRTLSDSVSETAEQVEEASAVDPTTDEVDYDKAYSSAEKFVKSYNDLMTSVKASGDRTVSNKASFITNMTNAYARRLEKVGIGVDKNGALSLDKEKFQKATTSQLESAFGEKKSFSSFMKDQAKQIAAYSEAERANKSNAYTQAGGITNIANISGSYFSMLG
ncbi:MAG: hypothetical protein NC084_07180 [Bacteroides sp.]|nr:hypothetical protein [Eubacterium sp.]MCM1418380.1 hypothetical protein [Roseburia sp.]MCM1462481.1 hypothetical protein [Bacteroides sp.]